MTGRHVEERRIGIAQLSARLGVSGRTISRWCAADPGFPRFHYVGTHRKWLLREIEAWEAEHCGPPPELAARVANLRGAATVRAVTNDPDALRALRLEDL